MRPGAQRAAGCRMLRKKATEDMNRMAVLIKPISEIVVGGVLGLAAGTVVGAAAGFFIARVWGII